jgi:outer membrane protein assembly factor BamD
MIARRLACGLLVGLLALVGGCGLLPEQKDETADWSAQKLYSEARSALNDGEYAQAVKYYESLEARYPFGKYAQQAQLEIAYAYYKDEEPDSALAALDRFIKLNPRHPNVDYAYYLKGLVNFNRGQGLVERYLPQDPAARDPGSALDAFEDFSTLVRLYPSSPYAADATQRMLYLRNNLASHELQVAEYYLRREAYVAAANRAKYVIENYPRAPAVPQALVVLAKAYRSMGLVDLADDAVRVLRLNYPDHPGIAEVERLAAGP